MDLKETCSSDDDDLSSCECLDAQERIDRGEIDCFQSRCPDDCPVCKHCFSHFTTCAEATRAPTTSPQPTVSPYPSAIPSATPKPTASTKPSASPTGTPMPTKSISPTKNEFIRTLNIPTSSPTIDCRGSAFGTFGRAKNALEVVIPFQFDLVYDEDALSLGGKTVGFILKEIDAQVSVVLVRELFPECATTRLRKRNLSSDLQILTMDRKLEILGEVVGLKSSPSKVVSDKSCDDSSGASSSCIVVGGETSVYVIGKVDLGLQGEMGETIVDMITENSGEIKNDIYSVKAIKSKSDLENEAIITEDQYYDDQYYDDQYYDDEVDDEVGALNTDDEIEIEPSRTLSGLDVSMITLSSCVIIAFGLLVHRRYRSHPESNSEENMDEWEPDDDDDDGNQQADMLHGKIISVIDESKAMLGKFLNLHDSIIFMSIAVDQQNNGLCNRGL